MKKFGVTIQRDPHLFVSVSLDKSPTISITLFGWSLVLGVYYAEKYTDFIPVEFKSDKEEKEIYELYKMLSLQ